MGINYNARIRNMNYLRDEMKKLLGIALKYCPNHYEYMEMSSRILYGNDKLNTLPLHCKREMYGYAQAIGDVIWDYHTINIWEFQSQVSSKITIADRDAKKAFERENKNETWYHERNWQYVGRVWIHNRTKVFTLSERYEGQYFGEQIEVFRKLQKEFDKKHGIK